MPRSHENRLLVSNTGSQSREAVPIGRRTFFAYTLSLTAGFLLVGCGGGGGDDDSAPVIPEPTLVSADRSSATGTLQNQVNQFSESVNALSGTWDSNTAVFDALSQFSDGRSRQIDPTTANLFEANKLGLYSAQQSYERIAGALLTLDNLGYVGDMATSNNGLVGAAAVSNPQWVAAMMDRNFHALRLTATMLKLQRMQGIAEMVAWVRAEPDPNNRFLFYLLTADAFNGWVDRNIAAVKAVANPTLKLSLSEDLTVDTAMAELDRIPDILNRLPIGNGFATAPAAVRSSPIPTSLADFVTSEGYVLSFLGSIANHFSTVTNATSVAVESITRRITVNIPGGLLGKAGFNIGPGLTLVQTIATNGIRSLFETFLPGDAGKAASCAIDFATRGYGIFATMAASVGANFTLVGVGAGIALFGLGVQQIRSLCTQNIGPCAQQLGIPIPSFVEASCDALAASLSPDGQPPAGRDVPALTNPNSVESDQLSRAGVGEKTIPLPDSSKVSGVNPATDEPSFLRKLICGLLTGSTRQTPLAPRTFENVEAAVIGLIYDLGKRNPSTLQARLDSSTLRFFASDFAILISRAPGSTSATIPAITNADLLCSAPGFVPKRTTTPMDLNVIDSLPLLRALTELGTGVNVGVN